MADINPESEGLKKALLNLADELDKSRRHTGDFSDAQNEAAQKVNKSSEDTKAALKQFGDQVGQSALAFGKALATGGEGTGKYGGAVEGAANAVGDLAGKLGIFGSIVGGIIKIFGGLASASLKQNDTMMKSYRDLSEMGSVSGTLEKVMDDFHKVGLTSEEAEKFGNMLKKVAPELGAFGGSVSAGKDKMVGVIQGMIGPGNQIERGMARIGYGAEEMRDATADYIKKQTNLGLSQGKTTDQLRTESVKYMTSLRELQELTGMQRDEAQKLMDEQQADARWALTLKRIEAEEGEEAAKRARFAMAAYSAEFGKSAATDLMEQVANKGAVVGEASARAQQSTLGEGYRNFRKVVEGQSDAGHMIIDTSNAMAKNYKTLDGSIMAAGQGLNQLTGDNIQMGGAFKNAGRTYEDVQKSIAEKAKISGDRLDQNVDIEQKSRQMRIAADNALMATGDLVIGAFQRLQDIMFKFAKTLAQLMDWVNKTIFRKETNFADSFKDKDDFKGDLNVATNAKLAAEEKAANLEKNLKEIEADKTGGVLRQKIKDLEEQVRSTNSQETVDANGNPTGIVTGGDPIANAKAREELDQLKQIKEQISMRGGHLNIEKVTQIREQKLQDLKEQIAKEDLRIQNAKKNLGQFEASGANGPIAGSAGYMAKYNPGGMAGAGMAQTVPNVNASGPPDLGNKKLEDIIKFGTGTGDMNHFQSMDPNVANAFTAMAKEYFDRFGKQLQINSAYRTPEEQAAVNSGNNPKAAPGKSLHNIGRALDINSDQVQALLSSGLLQKYGFQPLQGDPPHIQYGARDGGVFDGPDTGYPVMLHGNEAVIPMPNLQDFTDSVKKENLETIKGMDTGNREPVIQQIDSGISSEFMNSMMTMMAGKFDEMIRHLDSSHSTQQQILTYTKA